MTEYRWAVDSLSGAFMYGGVEPYDVTPGLSPTQRRVVLPRAPDPRTEKYGTPDVPFATKTAAEISAYDNAQHTSRVAAEIDGAHALKAVMICALWGRLNRQPTAPEIAAERARFIAIYKTL